MKSLVGRPRSLTDEQVALILAWHEAMLAWRAQRRSLETLRQLAANLGVSRATISSVIRRRGEFKQASPETRAAALASRRARVPPRRRR